MGNPFMLARPEVQIERSADGAIVYADAEGIQVAIDTGDDVAVVTVVLPIEVLRALKCLLSHPQLADLLGEPDARPPVA